MADPRGIAELVPLLAWEVLRAPPSAASLAAHSSCLAAAAAAAAAEAIGDGLSVGVVTVVVLLWWLVPRWLPLCR